MMKFAILAGMPLLLSACAIPAAVVVTSAVDGVTFLSSGKSITSHTLSATAEKDCSILFGITRGEFCRENEKTNNFANIDAGFVVPNDQSTVGKYMTTPGSEGRSARMQPGSEPGFFNFHNEALPTTMAYAGSAPKAMSAPAAGQPNAHQPRWALVLGSFAKFSNAIKLARQVKPEPGLVTPIVVRGKVHYRVSTRALRRDQAAGRQLNLAALKVETVKLMPVCPVQMRNDNCIALDRPLTVQQVKLP